MKIISHRGLWEKPSEKNSSESFERSFYEGFGTETDLRDSSGKIVISHDMPSGDEITLSDFLSLVSSYDSKEPLTVALNIKADGLADTLLRELENITSIEPFVFDMSVPDMRSYLRAGFNVFGRMSEVECKPPWLDQCSGIWLDSFDSDWFSEAFVSELLNSNKIVCVVSPELHGRNYNCLWEKIYPLRQRSSLILCTDYPLEARKYFDL